MSICCQRLASVLTFAASLELLTIDVSASTPGTVSFIRRASSCCVIILTLSMYVVDITAFRRSLGTVVCMRQP